MDEEALDDKAWRLWMIKHGVEALEALDDEAWKMEVCSMEYGH